MKNGTNFIQDYTDSRTSSIRSFASKSDEKFLHTIPCNIRSNWFLEEGLQYSISFWHIGMNLMNSQPWIALLLPSLNSITKRYYVNFAS